ncbi:MAG TPA: phenylalanine--tRNA ligase subunit beta, partial [Thermoanaerobaculia bacterium]
MKLSLAWIGQYVELPAPPKEAADRVAALLTGAGLAVEGIERLADDAVLEVDITTNRPDCMNHLGVARELAVLLDRPLEPPAVELHESAEPALSAARVEIADPSGCSRFAARVIRGVTIGDSPEWLQERLLAIGHRPINNIVDITNFVLWETGQPLHAYDLAKLAGSCLVVRRAREGEKLVTLDGVSRDLGPGILVIADAERPVGLAGVMGGLDSEVTAETVDILLEGAHFDRKTVRKASRQLGLKTDASHRFERGADLEACGFAVGRASALMAEIAGGSVLAGGIDVRVGSRPERSGPLSLAKLNAFAGAEPEVAAGDVERWLTGLGFRVAATGDGAWHVTVPSWRYFDFEPRRGTDEIYPADLYEEVLRIHGFDRIPEALPAIAGADGPPTPLQRRRGALRRYLSAAGYAEAINFAFHDPQGDAAYPSLRPGARPLALANPLSERYSVMRRSLVPNLVANARFNQRRGAAVVRLFEVATVFFEQPGAPLPDQPEHVGLVAGGQLGSPWERQADLDLFDLKGAIDGLAAALGCELS